MTCNKKWILYNNWGQLAQWSSKALLKAQLAPNKGHGHSSVVCCWSDPPQLSESWRNHYTWEACLADWWNALVTQRLQPAPINRKGNSPKQCLTHATQPELQTLSKLGCEGSPHPLCSSHLSPTNYHFFTHLHNFLQGKHFHNQQHAQNAFQEPIESQSVGFYTIGINLFLIDKNVLIVMIPILINKEVFEPSYNDLKLMVWNCNYFCTSHVNH